MKTLLLMAMFTVVSCQAKEKPVEVTPAATTETATAPAKEDCDDKAAAAKKVEIKEEGISLSNNTAGCTLE